MSRRCFRILLSERLWRQARTFFDNIQTGKRTFLVFAVFVERGRDEDDARENSNTQQRDQFQLI